MYIEIQADQWEEQQQILEEIIVELLEDGEEIRIFNEETEDELTF